MCQFLREYINSKKLKQFEFVLRGTGYEENNQFGLKFNQKFCNKKEQSSPVDLRYCRIVNFMGVVYPIIISKLCQELELKETYNLCDKWCKDIVAYSDLSGVERLIFDVSSFGDINIRINQSNYRNNDNQDIICQFAQKLISLNNLQIMFYLDDETQWQGMLLFVRYLKDILIENDTRMAVELCVKNSHEREAPVIINTQDILEITNEIGQTKHSINISLDTHDVSEESIPTVLKHYFSNKSVVDNVQSVAIDCDVLSIFDVLFSKVSSNKKDDDNSNNLQQVDLMKGKNLKYLQLNVNPDCMGVESFDLIINYLKWIYNYHCLNPNNHIGCQLDLCIAIDKPLSAFEDELKELFELIAYKFSESRIAIDLLVHVYYKFFENSFWEEGADDEGFSKEAKEKFKQYLKVLRKDYLKYYHEIFKSIIDCEVLEKFKYPIKNEYCQEILQHELKFQLECGLREPDDEEDGPRLTDVILNITIANSE